MKDQPNRRGPATKESPRPGTGPASQALPPAQRWRLTFARERDPDRRTHREIADEWIGRVRESGLPLPDAAGRLRVPVTFAAPLPAGMECRAELADLWLREARPLWQVREAVAVTLPARVVLLGLDDVWVGAPPLQAALRAADYVVSLPEDAPLEALEEAVGGLMAAPTLERARTRGTSTVQVDVRPLIDSVHVLGEPPRLEIRTRFFPDRGAGRPEDVLDVLATTLDAPIEWGDIVRERLILAE